MPVCFVLVVVLRVLAVGVARAPPAGAPPVPLHPWFMVERVCVELCWVLGVNIHTLLVCMYVGR